MNNGFVTIHLPAPVALVNTQGAPLHQHMGGEVEVPPPELPVTPVPQGPALEVMDTAPAQVFDNPRDVVAPSPAANQGEAQAAAAQTGAAQPSRGNGEPGLGCDCSALCGCFSMGLWCGYIFTAPGPTSVALGWSAIGFGGAALACCCCEMLGCCDH